MSRRNLSNVYMNTIHVAADRVTSPETLARVDLNLIVALDALARERSVTRAARRMGVTQSAMSHTLRRLRELLGDPLLVRGRGGLVLTPRAEALAIPVRSGLATIRRALEARAAFDPRRAQRAFSLAAPDLFHALLLPPLLDRLRHEAPGVDLSVVAEDHRALAVQLETGDLDVAVLPHVDEEEGAAAPGLMRRALLRDRFACLMRADHPILRAKAGHRRLRRDAARLKLEDYAKLSHILVSPQGEGPGVVDRALARRGLSRRVVLRVPSFVSALAIVGKGDLVLTAPTALSRLAPSPHAVASLPAPLALPGHTVHLLWHERFTHEPGHRWLRELIAEVASAELTEYRTGPSKPR